MRHPTILGDLLYRPPSPRKTVSDILGSLLPRLLSLGPLVRIQPGAPLFSLGNLNFVSPLVDATFSLQQSRSKHERLSGQTPFLESVATTMAGMHKAPGDA